MSTIQPPDNADSELNDVLDKFEDWYRWQFLDMGEPKKRPNVFIMNRIDTKAAIQALITAAYEKGQDDAIKKYASLNYEEGRTAAAKETAKAYGGCTKCYGKGYATWRHGETSRGKTSNMRTDIKYCTCERGQQLETLTNDAISEARQEEVKYLMQWNGSFIHDRCGLRIDGILHRAVLEQRLAQLTQTNQEASNGID